MVNMIKPPIILAEGLDVTVYTSIEEVELDIEPIDVINNVCTVYDSEGRLLRLTVEYVQKKEKKKGLCGLIEHIVETLLPPEPKVVLKSAEDEPKHKEELCEVLIESLASQGVSQEFLSKASLEELINKAIESGRLKKLFS